MRIAVTGSSGLIGTTLVQALLRDGHDILRLVRARPTGRGAAYWDPANGVLDPAVLRGVDAVVNLSGKNIGDGRWTTSNKRQLRASRVDSTRLLAETMAALGPDEGPGTLVSMAGVNYYGSRNDELLPESATPGTGFMAELSQAWETAADPARAGGIRVVHVRGGIVLSPEGGALAQLLPLFRFGVGGRLGNGRQWWSWIGVDDLVGLIRYALDQPRLSGPVNGVAPEPVTNAEFTAVLARVLHRPAVLPAPAAALRLIVGELADELLLASIRAVPERALAAGYRFRHPELEGALRAVLHRAEPL